MKRTAGAAVKVICGIAIFFLVLIDAVAIPLVLFGPERNLIVILITFAILVVLPIILIKNALAYAKKLDGGIEDKTHYERTINDIAHVSGLPLADGIKCSVVYNVDSLTIKGGGNTFSLSYSNITGLDVKTKSEIEKHYVSSAGGAVAGAMLFGPVGAIIGGRTKKVTDIRSTSFYIITYKQKGEVKYIVFEVNDLNIAYKIRQRNNDILGHTQSSNQVISLDE